MHDSANSDSSQVNQNALAELHFTIETLDKDNKKFLKVITDLEQENALLKASQVTYIKEIE